jgi:hypothetical protein
MPRWGMDASQVIERLSDRESLSQQEASDALEVHSCVHVASSPLDAALCNTPRVVDASSSSALDSVERGGANNRLQRLVHLTVHLMLTKCRDFLTTHSFPLGGAGVASECGAGTDRRVPRAAALEGIEMPPSSAPCSSEGDRCAESLRRRWVST